MELCQILKQDVHPKKVTVSSLKNQFTWVLKLTNLSKDAGTEKLVLTGEHQQFLHQARLPGVRLSLFRYECSDFLVLAFYLLTAVLFM